MSPIQENPRIPGAPISPGEQISPARQLGQESRATVRSSGVAWVIPQSSQPFNYAVDSPRHKTIADALLAAMGKSELIPTRVPINTEDVEKFEELDELEALKRVERNKLLHPRKESAIYETHFITPRKRAIMPNYVRAHVARTYRRLNRGTINLGFEEAHEPASPELGRMRLVRLGDNPWPGKPQHRLPY